MILKKLLPTVVFNTRILKGNGRSLFKAAKRILGLQALQSKASPKLGLACFSLHSSMNWMPSFGVQVTL